MCSRTLRFPDSQVNCLSITPDKQFVAAGGNPLIRLFEINSGNAQPVLTCEGHTSSVTSLGFQREGRWMYTGSEDGTVKIWDLRSSGWQRSFEPGGTKSRGGGGVDSKASKGSGGAPAPVAGVKSNPHLLKPSVNSCRLSPNQGEIISGDSAGNVRVWDLGTGQCVNELVPDGDNAIRAVDISDDGKSVIACNQKAEVFVWEPRGSTDFKVSE